MQILRSTGLVLLAAASFAQTPQQQKGAPPASGARELYYFGAGAKDKLPPIQKTAAPVVAAAPKQPRKAAPTSDSNAAVHLGLRYNLVLVDPDSGRSEPADSDRVFKKGDCLALDFDANRSGYLYVMVKQSSGNWQPLIPSPEASDEVNVIDPGQAVRAPRSHCFEISDPPGTETLFVVLSRDPSDFYELYQGIKGGNTTPVRQPTATPRDPVQVADARMVNNAVSQMSKQFGTRDLVIRRVAKPVDSRDVPNSVYVVNASDKPSSTVVTQIAIKHR
jgi:hypothetical protein